MSGTTEQKIEIVRNGSLEDSRAVNDRQSRDSLINEYFDLVPAVARSVRRSMAVHVELDDLVNAGIMGLVDAATRFDATKEVPFTIYAKLRIRGAILDSLRSLDWAGREARKSYRRMTVVTQELATTLQRTPTNAEVESAMGLDENRWRTLMMNFGTIGLASVRQSQATASEEEGKGYPEHSAPEAQNPDQVYARMEAEALVKDLIKSLPERYQQVIRMYYQDEMSMREIGHVIGVNESRVSQIHKSALTKMQAMFANGNSMAVAA